MEILQIGYEKYLDWVQTLGPSFTFLLRVSVLLLVPCCFMAIPLVVGNKSLRVTPYFLLPGLLVAMEVPVKFQFDRTPKGWVFAFTILNIVILPTVFSFLLLRKTRLIKTGVKFVYVLIAIAFVLNLWKL